MSEVLDFKGKPGVPYNLRIWEVGLGLEIYTVQIVHKENLSLWEYTVNTINWDNLLRKFERVYL